MMEVGADFSREFSNYYQTNSVGSFVSVYRDWFGIVVLF